MELLQDWTDYSHSEIWNISNNSYAENGIFNWSKSSAHSLPQLSSTNYQNALAFAYLIKKYLAIFPKDYKFKVLECGAGSGRFSRNLLLALSELGILDRVILIISDFQETILSQIKSQNILFDFQYGVNYEFELLDLTDLKLEENYDLIIMNFVLEALPLTVLKKTDTWQEAQVKLSKLKSRTGQGEEIICKNYRWQDYQWQSRLEKRFQGLFERVYSGLKQNHYRAYPYYALQALETLLTKLSLQGSIYITLLNDEKQGEFPSFYVGDILSHSLDAKLFEKFFTESENFCSQVKTVSQTRMIVSKDKNISRYLEPSLERFFYQNKNINRLIALEAYIDNFAKVELVDCFAFLLQELTSLNPRSAKINKLWSKYYKLIGDERNCAKYHRDAGNLDFWQDLN